MVLIRPGERLALLYAKRHKYDRQDLTCSIIWPSDFAIGRTVELAMYRRHILYQQLGLVQNGKDSQPQTKWLRFILSHKHSLIRKLTSCFLIRDCNG